MSLAENEQWRAIPGHDGYEASDFGRIRSVRRVVVNINGVSQTFQGRLLRQLTRRDGHRQLLLGRRQGPRFVHRLVLLAFVGPAPTGMEGCHRNGDPSDNRLSNLYWGTRSENELDKVRHGTHNEAAKTHCARQHPYSGANLYIEPRTGKRRCHTCLRAKRRAHRERKMMRAAGVAS